jgi:hypothetical protein
MVGDTTSRLKRAALWSLPVVLILAAAFVPVHGSSFATAAYSLIENSGSALTMRQTLNFTGSGVSCADDGTNKRTICTVGGGSGTFGGVNIQTGSYTLHSTDSGLLVVMNCSSACVATMYGTPSSTFSSSILSIGSTLATINLNSLNYNGISTVPLLSTGQLLSFGSDGSNYWGNQPFQASTNVTFGASGNNINVSASGGGGGGGGGTSGTFSSLPTCNSGANGTVFYATDTPISAVCNGTAWTYTAASFVSTPPSLTAFSGFNMGTSLCTSAASVSYNGIGALKAPTNSGDCVRGQQIALPATPFTVDACFVQNALTINSFNALGIYVTDGTKLVFFNGSTAAVSGGFPTINIGNYNTAISFNGQAVSNQPFIPLSGKYCYRWHDDGTNVEFYTSLTGTGTAAYSATDPNWQQFATLGRTAFLTPTNIGWAEDTFQTTQPVIGTALHWLVH